MKLFDQLMLAIVRWRMGRFKEPGDAASRVYDGVLSAIGAELVRRVQMHGDFNPQAFEASVARMQVQLEAVTKFEQLDVRSAVHF